MEFLTELLLKCKQASTPREKCEPRLRQVSSYLQSHFTDVPDFTEMARHSGHSPRLPNRHWSNFYHDAPGHYTAELKSTTPARLLRENDKSVAETGSILNSRDAFNLICAFRRHTGLTSLQFSGNDPDKNTR